MQGSFANISSHIQPTKSLRSGMTSLLQSGQVYVVANAFSSTETAFVLYMVVPVSTKSSGVSIVVYSLIAIWIALDC